MAQIFEDMELPTVQEVQTMIDESTVSKEDLDNAAHRLEEKIAEEKDARNDAIEDSSKAVRASLEEKIADQQTALEALNTAIENEEEIRLNSDNFIKEALSKEIADRQDANAAIMNALKQTESFNFEDNIVATRLTNLPFAQVTIENHDKTIKVNDVLGTVGARFIPAIPVTFSFVSEVTDGYAYISARIDSNTGNVTVINVTKLTDDYEGNINSVTISYIVKDDKE